MTAAGSSAPSQAPPPAPQNRWVARALGTSRFFTFPLWAAAVVFFARPLTPWSWVGAVLFVGGAAGRLWAAGYATPPGSGGSFPTGGPYGWLRNPLALGNAALAAGLALWAGGFVPWLPLASAAFIVGQDSLRVRAEDGIRERLFGWDYRAYRATVPLWLPRLTNRPFGPGGRWRVTTALRGEAGTIALAAFVVAASRLYPLLAAP